MFWTLAYAYFLLLAQSLDLVCVPRSSQYVIRYFVSVQ